MHGHVSLLLHAHLPFVRHPEHERFFEESWLYEAVLETYLPLVALLRRWDRDALPAVLTLTLSPTLCSMLRDPLLQERCTRRIQDLIRLAEAEVDRTCLDSQLQSLARFYLERFQSLHDLWTTIRRDLVDVFRQFQEAGRIEIITCAATHALLPMLAAHESSVRAQVRTACDDYRDCFGCDPQGIWLPECAYVQQLEPVLKESGLRWFVLESHGVLHGTPQPRRGVYAPVLTPNGLAAFGRDPESARQVWSRTDGYPGDVRYRDFYRDIGYDLDFDYVQPFLPSPCHRGFTGLKYHRITGRTQNKEIYCRESALEAVGAHAEHFVEERVRQLRRVSTVIGPSALVLMPYDAELFGHWWYEGFEFLDAVARRICDQPEALGMITPGKYLRCYPTHQVVTPAASSWGQHGYYEVWMNETNDWILPHLENAQHRMLELARRFQQPTVQEVRALNQALRELMLAQASDWPFLLRTGTSPQYARQRVTDHLLRFNQLHDQLVSAQIDDPRLRAWEHQDNLFPDIDYQVVLKPRATGSS